MTEIRRLSVSMLLIFAFISCIFLTVSAPYPYYGIVDFIFLGFAVIGVILYKKVEWLEPRALCFLTLALCVTSFFISYFYDLFALEKHAIAVAGMICGYATVPLIILYFHTITESYLFRHRELVTCFFGMVGIIAVLIACYANNLAIHTVYLIPAFFGYLFMMIFDWMRKPSRYFKFIHMGIVLLHLTIGTTLLITHMAYAPLFAGSIMINAISTFNIIARPY